MCSSRRGKNGRPFLMEFDPFLSAKRVEPGFPYVWCLGLSCGVVGCRLLTLREKSVQAAISFC